MFRRDEGTNYAEIDQTTPSKKRKRGNAAGSSSKKAVKKAANAKADAEDGEEDEERRGGQRLGRAKEVMLRRKMQPQLDAGVSSAMLNGWVLF